MFPSPKTAPSLSPHTSHNTRSVSGHPQIGVIFANQNKKVENHRHIVTPRRPEDQSAPASKPVLPPKPFLIQPRFVQRKLVSGQPKIYPNLNAAAAIPVDTEQVFHLHSFFDNYRVTRGNQHGLLVANSKYIFCRMMGGELLMHPTYRHPAIAAGKPVLYAGEAYFDNGKLQWWSNGSGNYRPDAEHAVQAELPMDRFYTYQDILKGRHKESRRAAQEENESRIIRSNADSGGNHAKRN